jgi:hypothetical protein
MVSIPGLLDLLGFLCFLPFWVTAALPPPVSFLGTSVLPLDQTILTDCECEVERCRA